MSNNETAISLRIFSGPHLGADIRLYSGIHVLGSGDSCDIILMDSTIKERHAILDVGFPPAQKQPIVRVRPVDGDILADDSPVPQSGITLPPCSPFYLGLSCFAWNMENSPWETVTARLSNQPQALNQNNTALVPPNDPIPPMKDNIAKMPTNIEGNGNIVVETAPDSKSWLKKIRTTGMLLVIFAILAALCFQFVPKGTRNREDAEYLALRLREKGITGVTASATARGIKAAGLVKNEQERTFIWQVAQEMQVPVQMDIQVQDDLARAVRDALNAQGLAVAVGLDDTGKVTLRGYMENKLIESAALSSVKSDVPNINEISRKIVFAEQLSPLLDAALAEAGLDHVVVRYTPGVVSITGVLTTEEKERLEHVFQNLEKQLDVPLRYVLVPPRPKKQSGKDASFGLGHKNSGRDDTEEPGDSGPFQGKRVTGVTMSPMKFITLDNGERIFEGGLLPGGHTLEQVSPRELTLRKGNTVSKYELK